MIKEINAITPEYMKHRIEEETEQYKQEIERLNNIIKEAKEYIQDYFYIDKETGEYYFTHTFDKCNVGELLEILGSDKE